MKRDDFGMRIDNIRELATKYNKQELARLVKMGTVSPQEALMAGMMIDRITKSAMQPPQTTVAEDVLGQTAPTAAQGQMPAGIMGAPGAPTPSAGVSGLPSNLHNMAGGGIVAFADGGDTDIPGYAGDKGSVVNAGVIDKIDPNWRSSRNRKFYSSEDKFAILAEQLRELQNSLGSATGEDKRRIESNISEVQQEMRRAKPYRAMTGLDALIPSAEAATPMAAAPAAPTGAERPKTARERLFEQQVMEEYGLGPQTLTPEQQKASQESANRALDYQLKQKQLQQIEGGMFSQKPLTEQEASEAQRIRSEMQGMQTKPTIPVAPGPAAPIPPSKFDVQPFVPKDEASAAPAAAAPSISRPEEIKAQQIELPSERTFGQEYEDIKTAYKDAGVDVDMYKNMMQELKDKKAGLAAKKEQALGSALMAFGLGLSGARKGQVMQQLGAEGQKALSLYMNNMDKIADNEDKIDILNRQIAMAENNFKRTGADAALAKVDEKRKERQSIMAKNAEMKQRASEHQATVGANLYHTDVWKQTTENVASAQTAAKLAAALGANKGGFTDQQLSKLYSDLDMQYGPQLREKYKNLGSKDQIESKVKEDLDQLVIDHVNKVRGIRQKGGIPVPSTTPQWQVD